MRSLPSSRLLHYDILGQLGAGAMGEVYRARDTKLEREVAIKILPAHFAADAERLKRFGREATTLASLNHPNVAQIFGVDEVDGICFLVLELVPGESLEDRLKRGPLPIAEAIDVCRQIAEGLEAAHEAGVIHRDLKPANVRITPDGKVKVLDFGLAKPAREPGETKGSPDSVLSTEEGRLLGTPTYMAPEQARGKPIDRRVDVWAFGCVLYECLVARRAFAGETLTDVLTAVVERDPDWTQLPAATPPRVRALAMRCLVKDAKLRLQAIGEARIRLAEADGRGDTGRERDGEALSPERTPSRAWLPWLAGTAIALVGATSPLWSAGIGRQPEAGRGSAATVRFTIAPPTGFALTVNLVRRANLGVSPSGDRIAFAAEKDGRTHLCVREVGSLAARPLPHTEGCTNFCFSPDGKWIAFLADSRLQKMPVDGGPPISLCDSAVEAGGIEPSLAWLADGTIVWCAGSNGAWRVSADGGAADNFVKAGPTVKTADGESTVLGLLSPTAVPGQSYLLACAWDGFTTESYHIVAISLADGSMRTVQRIATEPRVIAPDRLLFTRGSTVMTVGFDPARAVVVGEPTAALDQVRTDLWADTACIAASASGTFAYVPGGRLGNGRRLVRVDESGKVTPLLDTQDNYYSDLVVSPDGRRAVFATLRKRLELWVLDLERRSVSSLAASGENYFPVWSADGTSLLTNFTDARGVKSLARWPAAGGEPSILTVLPDFDSFPQMELPDGSGLLVRKVSYDTRASSDLEIFRYADGTSTPVRSRLAEEAMASISPDGKWLLYCSNESGRREVLLGPLHGDGADLQISTHGGSQPRFSRDGKRVFFLDPQHAMWSATLSTGDAKLAISAPTKLFDCRSLGAAEPMLDFAGYGVLPDGGFAIAEQAAWETEPPVIHVVLRWADELRAKASGR